MTNGSRKALSRVPERVSVKDILLGELEEIKGEGIKIGDLGLVAKRNHHKANKKAIERVFVEDEARLELVRWIKGTRYWWLHRDKVENFSLDGLRQYYGSCMEWAKYGARGRSKV